MNYKIFTLYGMLFFQMQIIFCAQEKYSIQLSIGDDVAPFCKSIAQVTIQGFSEYPCLFLNSLEAEMQSIFSWLKTEDSAVALLFYGDEIVGCMRGSVRYNNNEKQYYIAALVIDKKHRGKHLSGLLIQSLEDFAQSLGYETCCLASEKCDCQHVLKPSQYKDREYDFAGYKKCGIPQIKIWPTLQSDGTVLFQEHILISWQKKLGEK